MTTLINNLTLPQLEYYRTLCNFVGDEQTLFELRAKGYTLDECSEIMYRDLSSTKKLSRKIKDKMEYIAQLISMEDWIGKNF